jgi:Tfp pilus assembly PilM family ATPase/Tfp pilus assembly protein PilN
MEAGLMPQTVIGLDIGQSTIKAVLFTKKGLTGGRILAFETLDISACGGIEPVLKKLTENKSFSKIPCCVCLPLTEVMFRQVNLPFHDDNKIRKTLAFELEPLIPLPIDEVAADYLTIPDDGLFVAALAKKSIRDWIEKIEGNLGNVSIIDVSSTSLAAQILSDRSPSSCGVILDIGAVSTAAVFYENGAIVQIRSLAFGGNQITQALANDMSVEKDEAEQLKIKANYPASCAKVDSVCSHFCSELKNTIEYMKLNGALQNDPAHITITGGGSLFVPLQKELKNSFSLPLEALDLIRSKQLEIDENIVSKHPPQIMNTALAAAMRLSAGRKSFNFRQGEFATQNAGFDIKEQLKWLAVVAGIIFFLAAVNQFLDYRLQTQNLAGIKKHIAFLFKKNLPEAPAVIDPVPQLQKKLAENKKSFGFYEGSQDVPVVDLLKEISGLISTSHDIVINDFSYENSTVSIKAQAKNIDDVTAVKNELRQSKYFKDVTIGSTSLAKDGSKVDFDLRVELK